MKQLLTACVFSIAVLSLSGCASTPNPEKICTANWIGERSTKAMSRIESKAKPALKKLSKAAESWARGKKPNAIQLWSLQGSVKSLTKELESGKGMRDLKTLSQTCNDPKILTGAMTKMMRENGLSQQMIDFVERLPKYKSLIETQLKPQAVSQLSVAPKTSAHT